MARAIAIETSGRVGSIAVVHDGRVLEEEEQFPHGLQHAAQIVPIMDRLVRRAGWAPGEIEELYLSIGPGSFTGLRIAVTLAKTMALATGVKVVAVPSVEALAYNAPAEARHVIVLLDARRGQVFAARFSRVAVKSPVRSAAGRANPATEDWELIEPAHLDTVVAVLARAPRPIHLIGDGIAFHRNGIPAEAEVIVTPPDAWRARASIIASLGSARARRGEFDDPLALVPLYIRLPEAEEKWRDAQGCPPGRA